MSLNMGIDIVRYTEQLRNEWEQFIPTSINGNFLHSRSFFDHNTLNSKDDCSFIYYKKNKIICILPCTLYVKDGMKILQSHLRSTYGGFVINEEVGINEALKMVEKIIIEARGLKVNEIIIRNPFKIFYNTISDEIDYAMWYHNFKLRSRELEIYVKLNDTISTIKKKYDNGTKYNIKKALNNVEVRESKDYKIFWGILEENLISKHGKSPIHSIDTFRLLLTNIGDDKIKLFAGFVNEKLVGGCLIFIINKKALHAQYIAQDSTYQEYRPVNAIIDHIIEWGNLNSFDYFNLGTANDDGGRVINEGLFHFKESFGGRGVLRETMHLQL